MTVYIYIYIYIYSVFMLFGGQALEWKPALAELSK